MKKLIRKWLGIDELEQISLDAWMSHEKDIDEVATLASELGNQLKLSDLDRFNEMTSLAKKLGYKWDLGKSSWIKRT